MEQDNCAYSALGWTSLGLTGLSLLALAWCAGLSWAWLAFLLACLTWLTCLLAKLGLFAKLSFALLSLTLLNLLGCLLSY